jgi:hypothetical protein
MVLSARAPAQPIKMQNTNVTISLRMDICSGLIGGGGHTHIDFLAKTILVHDR